MPADLGALASAAVIALYLAVLLVPGALVGFAAGLRGWVLAGTAPLLTYTVAGLAGPWYSAIGVRFEVVTFALATAVFAAVAFGLRLLAMRIHQRRHGGERPVQAALWARRGHLAVLACLVAAAGIGIYTVLDGLGNLNAVAQGYDAVFHANGTRYIADTGDGGLFGMSQTDWYGDATKVFYPNAYHLLAAIAYHLTGASIPAVLNADTVLLPGLLALSLVTVVREFRGRAVTAGAVALLAVAPMALLYESMARGPLLPFLVGLTLTPLGAVTLHRYLERPALDTGFVFIAATAGLLAVHSSTLTAGVLFALPLVAQRWLVSGPVCRLRRVGRDLLALLPVAACAVAASWLQLAGAVFAATGNVPYDGWPNEGLPSQALGNLLSFEHREPRPQVWLAAALLLGFVFLRRLGELRWVAGAAAVTGLFYIAVSSTDGSLVKALSRPWWNDPYRMLAMAVVPLVVIAAHGLAELQGWLQRELDGLPSPPKWLKGAPWRAAAIGAIVLIGFTGASKGLYATTNAAIVRGGYQWPATPHRMPVSRDEAAAMLELGRLAKPGDWAMNGRYDGTAWTYAIAGVRTVAGHYDLTNAPSDARLLAQHFRDYATDPRVRAVVRKLNVRWVIVGVQGWPLDVPREPGLTGLDDLPFLKLVYRDQDASVYRLLPA